MAQNSAPRINYVKLRDLFLQCFVLDELESLCLDLGVNSQDIYPPISTRPTAIEKLIIYFAHHNDVHALINKAQQQRPETNWSTVRDSNAPNSYLSPDILSTDKQREVALLVDYRQNLLSNDAIRYVNFSGVPLLRDRNGQRIEPKVELNKVYIRLLAVEQEQERKRREQEERELMRDAPQSTLGSIRTLGEFLYRQGRIVDRDKRPSPVDPLGALDENKRIVILGPPGAGKSTLLKFFALHAAEQTEGHIPILVPLRDYATALGAEPDLSLLNFALDRASNGSLSLLTALRHAADEGQVLWLIDALDEAREHAHRAAEQVSSLKGQLVLTSRPAGYRRTGLQSLKHFEVLPLVTESIEKFLDDWFGLMAQTRGDSADWVEQQVAALQAKLKDKPGLRRLIQNPLLLTFIVVIAGNDPQRALPDRRSEFYKLYIEDLLSSWEAYKAKTNELNIGAVADCAQKSDNPRLLWKAAEHLLRYGHRDAAAKVMARYTTLVAQDSPALDIVLHS